jgi:hypothetical protein
MDFQHFQKSPEPQSEKMQRKRDSFFREFDLETLRTRQKKAPIAKKKMDKSNWRQW